MKFDPFKDPDLIQRLMKLRAQDEDKFMELVYSTISSWPDKVSEKSEDSENKLKAIRKVREHYEQKENYERCAVLFNMEKKIDGKEG
jgi:LmbE family N-acetylglucosaminyl deacetylase